MPGTVMQHMKRQPVNRSAADARQHANWQHLDGHEAIQAARRRCKVLGPHVAQHENQGVAHEAQVKERDEHRQNLRV